MRFLAIFLAFFGLSAVAQAKDFAISYAPLVKKAAPAVVNIYTSHKVQVISPLMSDPFFQQFFGGGVVQQHEVTSLGSGVIVDKSGMVMTNNHVVKDSDEIKVVLNDKREFEAKIVVADSKTDLAILRLKNVDAVLPTLEFADSDKVEVGDRVLAIGNPFGVGQTVTSGIVSALARTTEGINDYQFFIQTDAAINPGNSGGALVDMEGRLLGINTAIYSRTGGSNGIGFAIPANMVAAIINSHKEGGKIVRPWFGATFQTVTQDVADSVGLSPPKGALIKEIYPDGPAAYAGVQVGDIVLKFDDKDIDDPQTLKFRIATTSIGKSVPVEVMRQGGITKLSMQMEAPKETSPKNILHIEGNSPLSGVTVANLSPALANELSMRELGGIVIMEVVPQSKAGLIGFARGDVILSVNNRKVATVKELRAMLSKKVNSWLISLQRGNQLVEVRIAN